MDEAFFGTDPYHILVFAVGALVILATWLPRFVSSRQLSGAGFLLVLGAAAFALVPGMPPAIDPRASPKFWELTSEIAVIVALFGTGLRIDNLKHFTLWGPTLRLLAITMPITIIAVAVLGYTMGGLTLAGALLLGAVLSPTDPVLAGDVQVGPPLEGAEHPVRFTLTTEAGLNDGLAFPFVYLGLVVAAGEFNAGTDLLHWFLQDVLYRIGTGVLFGWIIGLLLGRVMFVYPRGRVLADTTSGIVALAGILFCYGATELVEGYGFIAVFVMAVALRRVERNHGFHRRLHDFAEAIELAVTTLILVLLGGALPTLFLDLGWTHVIIGLALIFVIRPVAGWIGLLGSDIRGRDRWVVAIYGVRGVGSIYYLAYASGHIEFVNEPQLWALIGFVILVSTLVHGLTSGTAMEGVSEDDDKQAA